MPNPIPEPTHTTHGAMTWGPGACALCWNHSLIVECYNRLLRENEGKPGHVYPIPEGEERKEPDADGFVYEDCSVEVWRWGRKIRLSIRSTERTGTCIELSLSDAQDLAERLISTMNADRRKIRDEPQA